MLRSSVRAINATVSFWVADYITASSEDGCVGVAMDITFPGIRNVQRSVLWRDWRGWASSHQCQS